MFIDEIEIKVKAGDGGDGCSSFRREKYVEFGGPDGGNGGRGASVIFVADNSLRTLLDFKFNKFIKAPKGVNGSGKNQYGKNAEDVYVKVPVGTVVRDIETNLLLADLTKNNMEVVIAKGGRGGRGNAFFKTSKNNAPEFSEYGEPGEERQLSLELKLLADVGFVGLPSVGKSTILSMITKAKPKIADYHFTTIVPNLGVSYDKNMRSFVVADLPGLIEGASSGKGLGDEFLRHIERTKVIAHVIDMGAKEFRDPNEDYKQIMNELNSYNPKILNKKQIVIANKCDLENFEENLAKFKEEFSDVEVFEVSALNNIGLDEVVERLAELVTEIPDEDLYEEDEFESHVLYKFENEDVFNVYKEADNLYVVRGEYIEKLFKMTKFQTYEARVRFAQKLKKLGVEKELSKLGCESGDTVRILDSEFEFTESD